MNDADKAFAAAVAEIDRAKAEGWETLDFLPSRFDSLERLPAEIADLHQVRNLDLGNTSITDLTPLSGLTRLRRLWMDGASVTDLTPLSGLTELRELRLDSTAVKDLTPLAGLKGLLDLRLRETEVTHLEALSRMTGLREIWLGGTEITDLTPLSSLAQLTVLDLEGVGVTDLTPLSGLKNLHELSLLGTGATDLRPLRALHKLVEEPFGNGLIFHGSAACAGDPEIARISEIEDNSDRARALFDYLADWVPPGEDHMPSDNQIEAALHEPILSASLAEIEEQSDQFHATALVDAPAKAVDRRHVDLVGNLDFISDRMSAASVENRLGKDVRQNFKDYREFIRQEPINGRILSFLAKGIRDVFNDPYTSDALDAFDRSQLGGFLSEHDALLREYYPDALRGASYETHTPPQQLVEEMPLRLQAARDILKAPEAEHVFAPSVSDALEMLYRREEGARRGYLTASDEARREAAGKELQAVSVLVTAYLGRIQARLTQWLKRTGQWSLAQVEFAKENPVTVGGGCRVWGPGSSGFLAN